MARRALSLALVILIDVTLWPCIAKFVVDLEAEGDEEAEPNLPCPDGYICTFEPVPCKIPNSNEQPGPACACNDAFSGQISWQGETPSGTCTPAKSMVQNSLGSGPDARCEDGYSGDITWKAGRAFGPCTPATCKIPNSNEQPGPACACKDAFSGQISWQGKTPSGACTPSKCTVPNSIDTGPDARCEDGYSGDITWKAGRAFGPCTPAICKIPNSNEQPGPACACKDAFRGQISWQGETPSGTCTPAKSMVLKSVGSGPDARCEDGYSGVITWKGSNSSGICVENEVEMNPLLNAQDSLDERGSLRFKCCAASEHNMATYQLVDMTQNPPPSKGADACTAMVGANWTASPDTCMLKPSYVAEVTSVPRDDVVKAIEKAKMLDGVDLNYVNLDVKVMNVDSNEIFNVEKPELVPALRKRLEGTILAELGDKAKVIDIKLEQGSLLIYAQIWPPVTYGEEPGSEVLKAFIQEDKDRFTQNLETRFKQIEEVSSMATGEIMVEVGDPVISHAPTVYRGVARCCCKRDDASTCEIVRSDKIKLSWNPMRWGKPVCPNRLGLHHYSRYPSLNDSLPDACKGATWNFLDTEGTKVASLIALAE